jgi:hypothetical protein
VVFEYFAKARRQGSPAFVLKCGQHPEERRPAPFPVQSSSARRALLVDSENHVITWAFKHDCFLVSRTAKLDLQLAGYEHRQRSGGIEGSLFRAHDSRPPGCPLHFDMLGIEESLGKLA